MLKKERRRTFYIWAANTTGQTKVNKYNDDDDHHPDKDGSNHYYPAVFVHYQELRSVRELSNFGQQHYLVILGNRTIQ